MAKSDMSDARFIIACAWVIWLTGLSGTQSLRAQVASESIEVTRENSPQVLLTNAEQAWLEAHPDIVLGYTDSLEPAVIANPDGTYSGMVVDVLDLLNERLGTNFGMEVYSIPELLKNAQERKVDGILNIHPEYSENLGLLSTQAFWPGYPAVFARKGYSFESPEDFVGKQLAIIDNVYFTEKLIEQYGKQATVLKVPDAMEGLQSVERGEVDYFLATSYVSYFISKYQLFNVTTAYVFRDSPVWFGTGVRSDWPELVSILNKGIATFSREEIQTIVAKWSYLPAKQETIDLTSEEKAWIAQNHEVWVRVSSFEPHVFLDGEEPCGIAIDYLNLIAERTGIRFNFVDEPRGFWGAVDSMARSQGPDLMFGMERDLEQQDEILFSKDYMLAPQVIYTQVEGGFIAGIDDLQGRTLAVVGSAHRYADRFEGIAIQRFTGAAEALRAVSLGQVDACVCDLLVATYAIMEHGYSNLKVAAPGPLKDRHLCFGNRPDWPELTSLINKGLATITQAEKSAINGKYLSLQYEHSIRLSDVMKWALGIAGLAILIILLFVVWNRQLARKVEQRTAEIVESEERFRATFEQAAVGIAHVSTEGRFLRINQKFCDILGYSLKEMLQQTFQNITYVDDLAADLQEVQQLLAGQMDSYAMEKRYIRKNGKLVWTHLTVSLVRDEIGHPQWFVAVVKDISDRKQAENEIRDSEEKVRRLIEQSPISIQIHGPDGRLLRSNAAYARLYALNPETLAELYEKYNVLDDKQAIEKRLMPFIESAFRGKVVNFPPYEYDGVDTLETLDISNPVSRRCWIQTRGFPIYDSNGEVSNVVFMSEDVTETLKSEADLRQLREQLLHTSRKETMGELSSAIAHELNQPLASIMSNTQAALRFLDRENPPLDKVKEILSDVVKNDRRASDIIRKLRMLLKKDTSEFSAVNINDVVEEVLIFTHSNSVIKSVDIEKRLTENLPLVLGDRTQLQQVLLNLIINASDSLADTTKDNRQIVITANCENEKEVFISVKDFGCGIDESLLNDLFNPFVTTKKEGMGMGLAINKTIIQAHGGRIWAENNPDEGATFNVVLPIMEKT